MRKTPHPHSSESLCDLLENENGNGNENENEKIGTKRR
jgi:hypothetical protein